MKRIKQWIAALCMTVSMTMTAFGGQWMQDNSGWWYQNDDGSYPVNCWQWIDENGDGLAECYYFNADGYCLMNGQTPDGNFVDASGAWVVGAVVQTQAVNLSGGANLSGGVNLSGGANLSGAANGNSSNSREAAANAGLSGWQNTGNAASGGWEAAGSTSTVNAGSSSGYTAEATVWLSATGAKYHRIPNCGRMNPNKARQVSLDEAVAGGYEPCKNCY